MKLLAFSAGLALGAYLATRYWRDWVMGDPAPFDYLNHV